MGMTPSDYFDAFVEPNYEDFKDNEWCVRRGFNASVSAFQMADHFYYFYERHEPGIVKAYNDKGEYFSYLYKTCPSFMDIRSIANAYKHLYTKGRNAVVSSTRAVEAVDIASKDVAEMITDYSKKSHREFVVYTKRTGEKIRLLHSLNIVVKMWKKEIYP